MYLSKVNKYIHSVLAVLGVLPFIGCLIMLLYPVSSPLFSGKIAETMSLYGLLIVSFIAGSHWGITLVGSQDKRVEIALSTNVVVVLLWLLYGRLSTPVMLCLEALMLAILLVQERLAWEMQVWPAGYATIRYWVTISVMVLLCLAANSLW